MGGDDEVRFFLRFAGTPDFQASVGGFEVEVGVVLRRANGVPGRGELAGYEGFALVSGVA